jgi:hypothetical protein
MKKILLPAFLSIGFVSTATQAQTDEPQIWDAKFQSTLIYQYHPPFNSHYSDVNSLLDTTEKSYTFTNTAYLGVRPWQDGELYVNIEMTEGAAFSDLSGLGGFANGEVTRVSGTSPTYYRQRLFLRQTWNSDGEQTKIEPDLNWFGGTVSSNRFVLTAGNFSTIDVFDGSVYSHDPRRQFMNWGQMTSDAFDYSADARGYSWGFAGEWYQDDWVLRFGRMTGPLSPNQLAMDFKIGSHYGDQLEVQHNHELEGQPGSLRFLAWRERAILARFSDAIQYGNSVNWRPDSVTGKQYIINVRTSEQIKYGLGFNMDQALRDDLGMFFKGMWTDGQTETLAFTEVDRSLTLGTSIKGTNWERPGDTLGIALMRNFLSPERRTYLALGGISFFIGDGGLNYRPEDIFECYYSFSASKHIWLTVDYQRINNPAYNADRGPLDIYSGRFHAEF